MAHSIVALIPARAGSKRIPGKNIRELAGLPLIAWTIKAAQESGIFEAVIVSTDSVEYERIAWDYGALVIPRPAKYATDISPDFEWVEYIANRGDGLDTDAFSILRPTSPFRTAATIKRAWAEFQTANNSEHYDSLRAVERVKQHPNKMWVQAGNRIIPYNSQVVYANGIMQPAHSVPTQLLPPVFAQNASLEIAWAKTLNKGNISGSQVLPFFTEGWEGFDLNTEADWMLAEILLAQGKVALGEPKKLPANTKKPVRRKRVRK